MKGAAVQRRDVEAFVRRKLDGLLRLGDGARRAALANLRRGAGRAPGVRAGGPQAVGKGCISEQKAPRRGFLFVLRRFSGR